MARSLRAARARTHSVIWSDPEERQISFVPRVQAPGVSATRCKRISGRVVVVLLPRRGVRLHRQTQTPLQQDGRAPWTSGPMAASLALFPRAPARCARPTLRSHRRARTPLRAPVASADVADAITAVVLVPRHLGAMSLPLALPLAVGLPVLGGFAMANKTRAEVEGYVAPRRARHAAMRSVPTLLHAAHTRSRRRARVTGGTVRCASRRGRRRTGPSPWRGRRCMPPWELRAGSSGARAAGSSRRCRWRSIPCSWPSTWRGARFSSERIRWCVVRRSISRSAFAAARPR
jgi:hypothetical protein